jgi:5'-nucleotidase
MTIILTNDDGINAPGIYALKNAINTNSHIFAPNKQYSGCGHQVTTHQPIEVTKLSENSYSIDGSPADCSRVAIAHFNNNVKYILSGINEGGNLGVDIHISGTVAAVREAAIHGIPGIAISHYIKRPLVIDWEIATKRAAKVLETLFKLPLAPRSFWNVNLPHLENHEPEPEIIFCAASVDPLPLNYHIEGNLYHYKGKYSERKITPKTDVEVCFSGNIAVTQISL